MIIDRLADLADIQARVLRRLMGMPDPDLAARVEGDKVILVARELTPSVTVQLDPKHVIGIATDLGTRTSHSAILARSLDIPCVVALGNLSETVRDGDELILDGRQGRVVDRAHGGGEGDVPAARLPGARVGAGAGAPGPPAGRDARRAARSRCAPTSTCPARRTARAPTARRAWGCTARSSSSSAAPRRRARRSSTTPTASVAEAFPGAARRHPHLRPGRRQVPGVPAHRARGEPVPGVARHPRVPGRAGDLPHAAARPGAGHGARRHPHHAPPGERDQRGGAQPGAAGAGLAAAAGGGRPRAGQLLAGRHDRDAGRGHAPRRSWRGTWTSFPSAPTTWCSTRWRWTAATRGWRGCTTPSIPPWCGCWT